MRRALTWALVLGWGYMHALDATNLKPVSDEILKKYPDSYVAITFAGAANHIEKNWKGWKDLLDARLAKHPDDEVLLRGHGVLRGGKGRLGSCALQRTDR